MESAITAAPNARKARWAARISQAAPAALLAAVLGFFAWLAITLVNISERVAAVEVEQQQLEKRMEEGFQQTNARLTRLETRVDDLYSRVNDIYELLSERLPPPPGNPPQR